jgi:hypothetical protein
VQALRDVFAEIDAKRDGIHIFKHRLGREFRPESIEHSPCDIARIAAPVADENDLLRHGLPITESGTDMRALRCAFRRD